MFLAFKLTDIITVPFGWLMGWLYQITGNYGVAMILFAVCVQMALMPITAKSKKSMMKMSRIQPQMQDIQRRYASDQQKQAEAIQQLQREEGVSLYGGCLWSFVPMFILFPLFTVIREPITYILGCSAEVSTQIVELLKGLAPDQFGSNVYYAQVTAAQLIPQFANEIQSALPTISDTVLAGINFDFMGINLGAIPNFQFWAWDAYSWANIGLFLIPLLSAGTQILQTKIMQKMNNSVVTDKNGVQDEETAKNSQANQTTQSMMWMMPLMSLWIGFTVSAGLSVYWFVGGIVRTIQDVILTSRYRKIYDAEDAVKLQRKMELDAIEAEKERIRAERRAANPEGQTQNTSKKKLQKAEAAKLAAEKAAAAREYNAKRGIVEEEEEETSNVMSGIPERPWCKGRAYDPNRYNR
ncbi:MAG: YidC/Oxa1 family membrane protein insertase [Ruminococcaceae bacterium]|nr:YidC/Oxa1 family membrane protein insertase [Oscillospiraceae bacterium]